jgi:hypothetical protein
MTTEMDPKRDSRPINPLFLALGAMGAAGREVLRDPETRALPFLAAALLLVGTAFYSLAEGWSVVESFYFSVVALTTVGFGDLTPSSDLTRAFTAVFILVGVGVFLALLTALIQKYVRDRR